MALLMIPPIGTVPCPGAGRLKLRKGTFAGAGGSLATGKLWMPVAPLHNSSSSPARTVDLPPAEFFFAVLWRGSGAAPDAERFARKISFRHRRAVRRVGALTDASPTGGKLLDKNCGARDQRLQNHRRVNQRPDDDLAGNPRRIKRERNGTARRVAALAARGPRRDRK